MHKNLQFCDVCGYVVVEKLLFTSTYWECKNCEEKKEAAKFIQDTFSSEIIVGIEKEEAPPRFKTIPNPDPVQGDTVWSPLRLPKLCFPVPTPIGLNSNPLNQTLTGIDVYISTGAWILKDDKYLYEYLWISRGR